MIEIRCRGCMRLLGIGPRDLRIYCDALCADDIAAVEAEGRDALIHAIFQHKSPPKATLGKMFGMSRQRVDQILSSRDLKEY